MGRSNLCPIFAGEAIPLGAEEPSRLSPRFPRGNEVSTRYFHPREVGGRIVGSVVEGLPANHLL